MRHLNLLFGSERSLVKTERKCHLGMPVRAQRFRHCCITKLYKKSLEQSPKEKFAFHGGYLASRILKTLALALYRGQISVIVFDCTRKKEWNNNKKGHHEGTGSVLLLGSMVDLHLSLERTVILNQDWTLLSWRWSWSCKESLGWPYQRHDLTLAFPQLVRCLTDTFVFIFI